MNTAAPESRDGETWARGDYARVAQLLTPAAARLAAVAGDGHGRSALDLATGTGSAALALADQGWAVSAIDACAPLLTKARRAARRSGLVVDFREAELTALPYGEDRFDLVTSSFGVIFSPDPSTTVRELARCMRPRGLLAVTAWTPGGYHGRMGASMASALGSTAGTDWTDPAVLGGILGAGFDHIEVELDTLPWRFDSVDSALDLYRHASPPHIAALDVLGDRAPELLQRLRADLDALTDSRGAIDIAAEYAVVTAYRR